MNKIFPSAKYQLKNSVWERIYSLTKEIIVIRRCKKSNHDFWPLKIEFAEPNKQIETKSIKQKGQYSQIV